MGIFVEVGCAERRCGLHEERNRVGSGTTYRNHPTHAIQSTLSRTLAQACQHETNYQSRILSQECTCAGEYHYFLLWGRGQLPGSVFIHSSTDAPNGAPNTRRRYGQTQTDTGTRREHLLRGLTKTKHSCCC